MRSLSEVILTRVLLRSCSTAAAAITASPDQASPSTRATPAPLPPQLPWLLLRLLLRSGAMKRDQQQQQQQQQQQATEVLADEEGSPPSSPLWVFGYGSLVWRPGFEFTSRKVGCIRGYSRRFWQGDTFHRGSEKMPGRVVTLQEDYNGSTWGVAYELHGDQVAASLKYLNVREAVLGGYVTKLVKFYPQEKELKEPILALVYIATPQNPSYLGPASEEDIAAQIIVSSGRAGHNIEYLLRLADFMRYCCPQVEDEHLFSIEEALISILPCLYHAEESVVEE
ncbi:glutathione-specific gamma-glutamylcyclotransferase 1 [Sceloporus undulatus]|uniref:glutathione-specific gamma-glutamylcyclotransferase 1 n=1 Tax=Sceloporus undulatus TaxID=8520 RepID=UPI001C4ABB91|nr:glutathione-specific gamma-glutamylcyclotransferase 1 [Sceloporus undulatus]